ncbi:MAG: NAD(P)/FAD-dependent oxidoreductase [Anaerovoracaceae bacterium]
MSKVIIIGNGPAGISASLYTKRAGIDTTVIGMGIGALKKADKIENYYGFAEPISGETMYENGIQSAKNLGVQLINDQVLSIGFEESLNVVCESQAYEADAVIIATGSARKVPKIPGVSEFEGRGVSYCAVCDGFFHRGNNVVVLGNGEYAVHEAKELLPIAGSVTILTNGEELTTTVPSEINVIKTKISKIDGDMVLSTVVFEDNSTMEITGFFVALGVAGSGDLARKLGAMTEGNKILVNEKMATNVPGLFAAGDCTPGMLQIAKAVYQGAEAGMAAVKFIREKSK